MISAAATWISLYLTKDRLPVSDWMYLNFERQNKAVHLTLQTFGNLAQTVPAERRGFYLSYSIPQEASYAGRLFARMMPSSWRPTELSLLFASVPRNRS